MMMHRKGNEHSQGHRHRGDRSHPRSLGLIAQRTHKEGQNNPFFNLYFLPQKTGLGGKKTGLGGKKTGLGGKKTGLGGKKVAVKY